MKAKEKVDFLHKIAGDCNPNNEAMFAIYATPKKGDYSVVGHMDLIRQGIYDILTKGISGKGDSTSTKIAWPILKALHDLRGEGVDIEALLDVFDGDDEPDDCPDCELFDKCQEERAKAWRTILKN